jgi:hypothetical protein
MINPELISYIKKQINNNLSKELILSKLAIAGWKIEDIKEGFSVVESALNRELANNNSSINRKSIDKYRESLSEEDDLSSEIVLQEKQDLEKKVDENIKGYEEEKNPKIEFSGIDVANIKGPDFINTKKDEPVKPVVEVADALPKEETSIEIFNPEIAVVEKPKIELVQSENLVKEELKIDPPKIWVPMTPRIKENTNNWDSDLGEKKEKHEVIKKEELTPELLSKPAVNSFGYIINGEDDKIIKKEEASSIDQSKIEKDLLMRSLPKMAMLSSYSSDLLSANIKEKDIVKKKRFKALKSVVFILIILVLMLTVFGVVSGYINIPFIKKDPKILLLNNSKILSSLQSYKTETNIKISLPSLASITSGLITGEVVSTSEKDFVSIVSNGVLDRNGEMILSDDSIIIESSLLSEDINTNIKNNITNSDLFIAIPDLSQVIKENIPKPALVKINKQQFELIPPIFSADIESKLKKVDLYKLLSNGMPSFVDNEILGVYDEFINNADILEKGQENIKGIDTYHYSINTERQTVKQLLSKMLDGFTSDLSIEDKEGLAKVFGAISIESLDVWVGKGDSNIYQYNVVLNIPISKIVGFEDKSIGDNMINLSWKTTYYDFNIPNDISIPSDSIPVTDFIKNLNEAKLKNVVSSFKQTATNLFNTDGSYGKVSNKDGSCMEPISGSLFSPLGHKKASVSTVSAISSSLNNILKTTNNNGLCYSTSKAWSFTIPIADDYVSIPIQPKYFFCIDSAGSTKELINPPISVVCE